MNVEGGQIKVPNIVTLDLRIHEFNGVVKVGRLDIRVPISTRQSLAVLIVDAAFGIHLRGLSNTLRGHFAMRSAPYWTEDPSPKSMGFHDKFFQGARGGNPTTANVMKIPQKPLSSQVRLFFRQR